MPKTTILPIRHLSTASNQLLAVCDEAEESAYRQPDAERRFRHPMMEIFQKKETVNPSKACFTRQYGKNETVLIEFQHSDYQLHEHEDEHDEDEHDEESESESESDPMIERFFRVKMIKENKPSLEFEATINDEDEELQIQTLTVDADNETSSYSIEFEDLGEEEQDALWNYVDERVTNDIGDFIIQYHKVLDRNLYLHWLNDMKEYLK